MKSMISNFKWNTVTNWYQTAKNDPYVYTHKSIDHKRNDKIIRYEWK